VLNVLWINVYTAKLRHDRCRIKILSNSYFFLWGFSDEKLGFDDILEALKKAFFQCH